MRKNTLLDTKGFLLMETLLVSLTIAGVLVYMYVQFSSIQDSYHRLYNYNSVEGLYHTEAIRHYLLVNADDAFFSRIDSNKVLKLTSSNSYLSTSDIWTTLWNDLGIDDLYVTVIQSGISEQVIDKNASFAPFLKTIDNSDSGSEYQILVKYNDGTFATVTFSKSSRVGD